MARTLIPAILLVGASLARAGWIIEQKTEDGQQRIVAGGSAWKQSEKNYDLARGHRRSDARRLTTVKAVRTQVSPLEFIPPVDYKSKPYRP